MANSACDSSPTWSGCCDSRYICGVDDRV
jgi:hypothetical protein